MPEQRGQHAIAVHDGSLYFFGGTVTEDVLAEGVFSYEYSTDTYTEGLASIPTKRSRLQASTVGDFIYVIGGWDKSRYLGTVEKYDPLKDSWTTGLEPMPTIRRDAAQVVHHGKIYVIGGREKGKQGSTANEVYDPDEDAWRSLAPMPTYRRQITAEVHDGVIYVFGGEDNETKDMDVVEAYHIDEDRWETGLAPMPTGRHEPASAIDSERGQIYVTGGDVGSRDVTGAHERYDIDTDTWSTLDPLPIPRYNFHGRWLDGAAHYPGGRVPAGDGVRDYHIYDPGQD
ncbi:hypothetical protein LRD18_10635 [Halorhodospira halochloris]|nr:kelch repeat-containing protein [Halorhodospira halochloris]MCG5531306.1 hypothetical protein [Halorhodospira halochloris]